MNASVLPYIFAGTVGDPGRNPWLIAQIVSPLQFLAVAFLLLALIGVLTLLIMSFILWGMGVELPGLSHLLKRISGRKPAGPWITDVFGGATPLVFVLGGWVALWVVLAVGLWVYSQLQGQAVATAPSPAPQVTAPVQPTPTAPSQPAPSPTAPPAAAPPPNEVVERILIEQGCGGCHTMQGISGMTGAIGPDLTRIGAVAAERIQDPNYTGSATTPAEYIRESIIDPNVYVVEGFQPVMPPGFGDRIPPDQLDLLVEYLASLE